MGALVGRHISHGRAGDHTGRLAWPVPRWLEADGRGIGPWDGVGVVALGRLAGKHALVGLHISYGRAVEHTRRLAWPLPWRPQQRAGVLAQDHAGLAGQFLGDQGRHYRLDDNVQRSSHVFRLRMRVACFSIDYLVIAAESPTVAIQFLATREP